MYWLDRPNAGKVTERVYRGIQCKKVENQGWKIILGDEEYLFKNFQEIKFAIDSIHQNCGCWYGGKKIK